MSRIYEVQERDGFVVARRTRVAPEGAEAAEGWEAVSARTFEQLSERKPGMMARRDGKKVVWEPACARALEVEKAALVRKAEHRAHEVVSKGKRLEILTRLVRHAVAVGIMLDPKSTREEAAEALARERTLREWLVGVEGELGELQDKVAVLLSAIEAADSPAKIKDVNLLSITG
jgi:hypothetical protein